MRPVLREYQVKDVEEIRQRIREGHRRIVYVCPTGGGKTVTSGEIIRGAGLKGKKIFFVAHRRELVLQCSDKLDAFEVPHGIIMASHPRRRPWENIHVCSIQTLSRREAPPHADIIIIDEAHQAPAKSYQNLIQRYPGSIVIGLTATPVRSDGKPLGDLFTAMVKSLSPEKLIERGDLVAARVFAPSKPDLSKIDVVAGEYNEEQSSQVMMEGSLVGDIVEHWTRLGRGRQTVGFATTVKHSKLMTERFQEAGIRVAHLDGTTPTPERDMILSRLRSGELEMVWNCMVLTHGWDCPPVSCIIMARPTKSEGLYLQMAGRALRPYPGKEDCLILDHAGCAYEHGLPGEERDWVLTRDEAKFKKKKKATVKTRIRVCLACFAAYLATLPRCPYCGAAPKEEVAHEKEKEGQLQEVSSIKRKNWYVEQLREIQQARGYKKGWLYFTFQSIKHLNHSERVRAIENLKARFLPGYSSRSTPFQA